ncbi:hypothetical protein E2C01_033918 [Portunus trituberculatus]|uniref:Zinc finger protein 503 n=1 Tax=Portunus trituberculatus TaxID=210409 RepID=A0A5B7F1F2_PORTR|nr:hypothetical protein [Portunus trituberculatus]
MRMVIQPPDHPPPNVNQTLFSPQLDAKKSPLALLAQTCSSIGADLSQKGGIPSVDKGTKGKSSPGAKSPGATLNITPSDAAKTTPSAASSFKPYEKKEDEDRISPSKRSSPHSRSPGGSQPSAERSSSRGSDSGRSSSRPRDPPSSSSSISPRVSSPSITPKSSSSVSAFGCLGDLTKDPLAAYKLAPSLYPHLALGLDPLGAAGLSALTAKVSQGRAQSGRGAGAGADWKCVVGRGFVSHQGGWRARGGVGAWEGGAA